MWMCMRSSERACVYEYGMKNTHGRIKYYPVTIERVDDLAQDCSNPIANALELLQSCAKPSMCVTLFIASGYMLNEN